MPVDATGDGSTPLSDDTATPVEATLSSNGSEPMATPEPAPAATESQPQDD